MTPQPTQQRARARRDSAFARSIAFFWTLLVLTLVFAPQSLMAQEQATQTDWRPEISQSYPQVEHGHLAVGTAQETPYYIIDSGQEGPTLAILGGTHGSEIAGWLAARRIVDWPISAGKLVIVPEANRPAVEARRRGASGIPDLNRRLPRTATGEPYGNLATEIWNLLQAHEPEWLMDMHEGYQFRRIDRRSVGQTIITYPSQAGMDMARKMVADLNQNIRLWRHQFQVIHPPISGSFARAAGLALGAHAFTTETAMPQRLSTRVNQKFIMTNTVMRELNMLPDLDAWTPGRFVRPLAKGTPQETNLYVIRGERPGPVVMVTAGVHGNKPSGVQAAWELTGTHVERGTLLVLPEADLQAVHEGVRFVDQDLNRQFPQRAGQEARGDLAQAIMDVMQEYGVRWLIDLHEGRNYQRVQPGSLGNTLIYHPTGDARDSGRAIVRWANGHIRPAHQNFSSLAEPIPGSLVRSAADVLGVKSFFLSTSARDAMDMRVIYHRRTVEEIMSRLNMR